MRFKLGMATIAIVAGLVLMPGTASAHGNGECRYFFDTGSEYWGPSQRISQGQTALYAFRAMQVCAWVRVEEVPPRNVAFWDWINNSAAYAIVWSQTNRVHVCKVDRDQTFANGRWFSGFNVHCTNH